MHCSLFLACLTLAAATGDPDTDASLQRFQRTETHMGTSFGVVLYASDQESANNAFAAAFTRIAELDRIYSDYDPESELSQLSSRSPTSEPVPVSDDLYDILRLAQELSVRSKGAFDITVGPLTKYWRRARRLRMPPEKEDITRMLESVGHEHLVVHPDSKQVELKRPHMRLDLGGIAPGYAANAALDEMAKLGITRALVNASGDICVSDPPPGEKAWKIDIAPLEPGGKPTRSVWLSNASVTTSGDAFQFVEFDGKRYSHIIDPRTGYGVTLRSSVTVIMPKGILADGYGTAVSVLGIDEGLKLIEQTAGAAAYIVAVENEKTKTYTSSRFEGYAEQPE